MQTESEQMEATRVHAEALAREMGLRGEERARGLAVMCNVAAETARRWLNGKARWTKLLGERFRWARIWWTPEAIVAELEGRAYVRPIAVCAGRSSVLYERGYEAQWPGRGSIVFVGAKSEERARAALERGEPELEAAIAVIERRG